ncbi:MAG: hypothetical protein A3G33_00845 [Omnitrophica bacterium RIFCSPLOWO2_12_FULL_44_17]|uniref:Uncharacterized protein n=1 Tax=Candidatus Danuiimicrobium aquiferis TaxID=1801832 RepID=A0A1G1L2Q9_9BACT|nr:MAG: hypothetical protein A3B72_06325 [Omnitrophica bacterium RIFCSPHIGHO2_02_FULL_45_28]OGW89783.1 MAG: hypothetical protein A3E74_07455 [Omnitrophica bacterium RIFCSPHIGHO2_12_FULL_44_12]OGW99427.1 MAG: hypothetical protein A3G33_00845 [Omnitrophica bacterium RIFCSPLOWO2_12_FULL_44_17]OGX03039.1 MAG: hypothetical protein A3J12_04830 [Omnitrophica bacterium RIFCSPLOWO2_02_FULL_44_11]
MALEAERKGDPKTTKFFLIWLFFYKLVAGIAGGDFLAKCLRYPQPILTKKIPRVINFHNILTRLSHRFCESTRKSLWAQLIAPKVLCPC